MTERIFFTIEPGAKLIVEPKPKRDDNKEVKPPYETGWVTFFPERIKQSNSLGD
jgi:hypothetical protein